MLFDYDFPIIKDLFASISPGTQAIDAVVYRATHDEQLNLLESLENRILLKRENDLYTLPLVSIYLLSDDVPEAKKILSACEKLFEYLRGSYKKDPRKSTSLEDMMAETGLSEIDVRTGLFYLRDAPIWGGCSINVLGAESLMAIPGEAILGFKTFRDVLDRLYSWCSIRAINPSYEIGDWVKNDQEEVIQTPAHKNGRAVRKESFSTNLPQTLAELMAEVDKGIAEKLNTLSAMGMRAAIDQICNDTVGDVGGFGKKLDKLESEGHITSRNKGILKNTLELCHASAHRAHSPSDNQVQATYQVVKHLINEIYVLDSAAKDLAASAPKRK